MVTNLLIPNFFIAARTLSWLSVINLGGLIGLANGVSDARTEAKAMITVSGGETEEFMAD
jgi:hypothetical protein